MTSVTEDTRPTAAGAQEPYHIPARPKNDDDDDASSVLSTSSSDPSSSSSSDDDEAEGAAASPDSNTNSRPPLGARTQNPKERSALRDQLRAFLPQLRAANEALDPTAKSAFEIVDGSVDAQAEDKSHRNGEGEGEEQPYIEMELGLGVLEEKGADAGESSSEDDGPQEGDEDVLGRLMGRKRRNQGAEEGQRKVVIQEL